MRIPRYKDLEEFHLALDEALVQFAKKCGVKNWPPTEKDHSPYRSIMCAKLFGDDGKNRWDLLRIYENRRLKRQPPTLYFGEKVWEILKESERPILTDACRKFGVQFISYPSVNECHTFYDFYQSSVDSRVKVKKSLCGYYVGYRPYWIPTIDNNLPILRFTLSIKPHHEDSSCLVVKEVITYNNLKNDTEMIIERSYGFLVVDEMFVHIYLKAETQRRHKHYVFTFFDPRLRTSKEVTLASGTCMVASTKGKIIDSIYPTGRGTVIQRFDEKHKNEERFKPSVINLSELPTFLAQRLELFDGGYFAKWDEQPSNSVNRALASKIIAQVKQIETPIEELLKIARLIDNFDKNKG